MVWNNEQKICNDLPNGGFRQFKLPFLLALSNILYILEIIILDGV